jgi:hypothetical protein
MLIENVKVKGSLSLALINEFGEIVETREENLVVDTGLAFIASRMAGVTEGVMSHMAVGTNSTAAIAGDTTLATETGRVSNDSTTIVTTNVANDSVEYVATFPAGTATGALVEAGLLNAVTAGTLLSRVVFAVINKNALDTLTITWKVTLL